MKISKQSFFICLSVALMLTFSLVSTSVAEEFKYTKPADETTVRVAPDPAKVNAYWDNMDWDMLTKAEQKLWGILNYNEPNWMGDAKPPKEDDYYFNQLSKAQQAAIKKMGYSKKIWDKGDPK